MGEVGESLLLRVFFETADGGYYSPMFNNCFEVLPIPEFKGRLVRQEVIPEFSYDRIPCRCGEGSLSKYLPTDYVLVGGSSYHINEIIAHWDPRLDIGVYSDYWRSAGGRIPKSFKEYRRRDCYIFFAAGLAKYPPKFFNSSHGFTEIRRAFMRADRGVYVVAYMKVDELADLTSIASREGIDIGKEGTERVWRIAVDEFGKRVIKTPHYARGGDLPVVILSEPGNYGFFKTPIPLIEWSGKRKLLSDYSYMFGIRSLDDRIRQKAFDRSRTEEILRTLEREGLL